ncbi:MAG: hypothetical protein RLZZ360_287 [Candidatus Parcubacteria bacterium]|jgi:hypothetical protein
MTNNIERLGHSKDNKVLYLDLDSSHAITHFAKHKNLKALISEHISNIVLDTPIVRVEIDTGSEVGLCDLVTTNETDEIVYAKRPLRHTYSRFAKNRQSEPTTWFVLDIRKQQSGNYFLYTAFIGRLTPSFPGGDFLPEQSRDFWSNHALVWGSQDVLPDSETTNCPW